MRGKQPYDTVNKTLIVNHVFGNDDTPRCGRISIAEKSIPAGMSYAGKPYSGKFGFIETEMNWFITHMVAPKEKAVRCGDCHTKSPEGRLAGLEGLLPAGTRCPRTKSHQLAGYGLAGHFWLCRYRPDHSRRIGHAFVRLFTRRYRSQP